jgi:capsular exopolysaccharide synthesis family protein
LSKRVKHSRGLDQDDKLHALDLGDIYRILYAGRWLIIAIVVIFIAGAVYLNSKMNYVYRASSTAMVVTSDPLVSSMMIGGAGAPMTFGIVDQLQILNSRKLAMLVVKKIRNSAYANRLHLLGFPDDPLGRSTEGAMDKLLNSLNVKQVVNSNMLRISIDAPTGFEAAFIANNVAQAFYEQNQEFSRAEFNELTGFLKNQLDKVTRKLHDAESVLTSFKEGSQLASLDIETSTVVQQSASAQAELDRISLELEANNVSLVNLRKNYSQGQSTLVEDMGNINTVMIGQLSAEIADKQAQITNIRARAETGWQDYVTRLEDELQRVKETLKAETQRMSMLEMRSTDPLGSMQQIFDKIVVLEIDNKALHSAQTTQAKIVAGYEARLAELPETSLEYVRYLRDVEINEKLYRMLVEKFEENQAISAGKIGNVRLLDEAEVPESPIRPNKRLNMIISILFGFMVGVGITIIRHLMNTTIVTPEDLKQFNLHMVGSIPSINIRKLDRALKMRDSKKLSEGEKNKIKRRLITHFSPKSPISESYRTVRTSVFVDLERHGKIVDGQASVIMVTSSTTQEGKSLTSANLAVTIAQTGRKTLVIDADMRRPTAHKNFNLSREKGLSGILSGSYSAESAIIETDVENLEVISAGAIPSNPSELICSTAMPKLLEWARQNYDFVIVDTPPVVPVTDPSIISTLVDGVILIIRSASSRKREVTEALSRLMHTDANILGVILNDYDMKRVYGSYYYYYHYYNTYHYYGDQKTRNKGKKRRKATRRGVTRGSVEEQMLGT